MASEPFSLDDIRIASPCNADWSEMTGDDRVRFCGSCRLNVYNLSGMRRDEAEALVKGAEGRLCVRFFRRSDGTMITRDCPVGLKTLHRRRGLKLRAVAAAVSLITAAGMFTAVSAEGIIQGRSAMKPCPTDPQEPPPVTMGKPAMSSMMGGLAAPKENEPRPEDLTHTGQSKPERR